MPFVAGTSSSLDNFISQMLDFAVANAGFTLGTTVTTSAGSGSVPVRSVTKGGVRFNFYADITYGIANGNMKGLAGFMSYSQATAGINISGNSTSSKIGSVFASNGMGGLCYGNVYSYNGPYPTHRFITDGLAVHAILEITTGIFMHVSFGMMTKYGAWTGGELMSISGGRGTSTAANWENDYYCPPFSASYNGNYDTYAKPHVRLANTNASADFVRLNTTTDITSSPGSFVITPPGRSVGTANKNMMANLLDFIPSSSAWRTLFTPIIFFRGTGTEHYAAGVVGNVAFTKLTDTMVNGQLIETDWRIYPLVQRGVVANGASYSANWAIAYKEVA